MPFTPYKSRLDSDAMEAALVAFALAWAELMGRPDAQDTQTARDLLAKRIVEAALEGERDPTRLKAYALEAFNP